MRSVLALAAALSATSAFAADAKPAADWVARSNEQAQVLLQTQSRFNPEQASFFGIAGADAFVADVGKDNGARFRAAMAQTRKDLEARLAKEADPLVQQDLQIMIDATRDQIEVSAVNEKFTRPWFDVGQLVFNGLQSLLQDNVAPERRAKVLERLQRYVGQAQGSAPITEEAIARYREADGNSALLYPVKANVEQALENLPVYLDGIRKLFEKHEVAGADAALAALQTQLTAWGDWTRKDVLPRARVDFRTPRELYALGLKNFGIDIAPELLAERARAAFIETRNAMQALAPQVAKAHGIDATDYRDVIRALKRKTIANDKLEAHYADINRDLEAAIVAHRVVDLPKRPMQMRLSSEAEAAAQPAPHFLPAPLIGNQGEQGTFVLPVGNPTAKDAYDDFNFDAVAWTLSAHEGRPGHELQFTAMVERGVSLARSLFAFNSVNVEGWALYAEAEMVPAEPLEGQLFALQFRLLRAARAMLDPMLNLGEVNLDEAERVLREDVVLSAGMTKQELDRYTFNAPGQAGSYYYGYQRLLDIRAEAEIALGAKFDRLAFNNFVLDQGMLPPDLLEKAVREQFVPQRRGK
jgi:uncharacterized protein (DUF885 family)